MCLDRVRVADKAHAACIVVWLDALAQWHRHAGHRHHVGRDVPVEIQVRIDLQQGLPSAEVHHVAITVDRRTVVNACRVTRRGVDIVTYPQFLGDVYRYRGRQRHSVPLADDRGVPPGLQPGWLLRRLPIPLHCK